MRGLLRQRRWLGFTVFALAIVVLTGFLAHWQWSRYRFRQTENAHLDAALTAAPQDIAGLLTAGPAGAGTLPDNLRWHPVTATGRYDIAGTVAVRRRPLDGRLGFWIVTPLITREGTVLVNRGWVAADGASATATPTVPTPPAGEVTVTGRLRPGETTTQTNPAPPGQAWAADPQTLIQPAETPRFAAYLEATGSDPADPAGLQALPPPEHKGANNFSYTFQWIAFGLVALFGWWRLMSAQAELEEAQADRSGGPR
ncbi:MAG: SURF1 family protein [Candidatus Nanopelagicales bacterium]